MYRLIYTQVKTGCLGNRIMCPSVTTDLHTENKAKTGCLGGRLMCLDAATDLHIIKSKYWLSRRQDHVFECNNWSTHMRKSKYWLSRGRIVCPSVATDKNTGERAKYGCPGGRIFCPRIVVDLSVDFHLNHRTIWKTGSACWCSTKQTSSNQNKLVHDIIWLKITNLNITTISYSISKTKRKLPIIITGSYEHGDKFSPMTWTS